MATVERPPKLRQIISRRWDIWAFTAAFLILLTPFFYMLQTRHPIAATDKDPTHFVGVQSCKECHAQIYEKWQGSHHDLAMAKATAKTVLGDFNNVVFTDPYTKKKSRFFKEDELFKVETEGPDGAPGTYTIAYTFGAYPLQQYLITFPGGRQQCLSVAWDVIKKQWYRLPPYDVTGPNDWLHWTKGGQTWNSMCAECHSTQLTKNYDFKDNAYKTTWFEINVGCEACHGPASDHLAWAKKPPLARAKVTNYGLKVASLNLLPAQQITMCAPCHSRRYQLGDNNHETKELLDLMVPSLLTEALYYPDGQIKEEDYVYGSFVQSKMYQRGVRCSDCHDVHSLKTYQDPNQNNALCLQCHRAADYDTIGHHFHQKIVDGKSSAGQLCIKCHMPGRYYMGIDFRLDHSLRIPRPDLSQRIGTPNSCSSMGCHNDKPLEWVVENYNKWYGQKRKPHYGEVFAAAQKEEPGQGEQLRQLAKDTLLPTIVRATALSLLRNYPSQANTESFIVALASPEALLRQTALSSIGQPSDEILLKQIAPKLYDPVRAVRIEAAVKLAQVEEKISVADKEAYKAALGEYIAAMSYNGDFAAQRYNLGNLARAQNKPEEAIGYYQAAIKIDDQFFPAKVNLAMLFSQIGQNEKAEKLLREVVEKNPQLYEAGYSLGLLLAEEHKYAEAAHYFGLAAEGMPTYTRVRYNQALALLKLEKWQEGADLLEKVIALEPETTEYFVALANLYLNFREYGRAKTLAETVLKRVPNHAAAQQLLDILKQQGH